MSVRLTQCCLCIVGFFRDAIFSFISYMYFAVALNICWFMYQLAYVKIWSTQEAWKARKRRKSFSRCSWEQLQSFECSPHSPSASLSQYTHSWSVNQFIYNIFNAINAAVTSDFIIIVGAQSSACQWILIHFQCAKLFYVNTIYHE